MPMKAIKKLKLQKIISIIIFVIGAMLMIYMIIVESEPGAIPLLLIVVGTGWYFISRSRTKPHDE